MAPLDVVAFTQGATIPSARFRVRQYLPQLQEAGIALRESAARFGSYPPAATWRRIPWLLASTAERAFAAAAASTADVVLFQREMVSTLAFAEYCCRAPAVLDVDDAIWLTQRCGMVDRLASRCRLVLCGNDYIAEHFAPIAPVRVLPTGVDTALWRPGLRDDKPVLVWSGSSGGLPYLYDIESALATVLAAVPDARLRVVCNAAPVFSSIDPARVEFIPWSPQSEVAAVQSAWVGLMPMPDTPWTRGKCSFKMLTYLACSVPAVASPWGMNRKVIDGGGAWGAVSAADWVDALVMLLRDADRCAVAGLAGRAQVEANYASVTLGHTLATVLREAAA
ncbi:hypothetical protein [Niveibacterium sp.]|uniref:hypothetical protein n=1 Tax=Niveibacterium sp. TaxID=2017444 RepID=UPI0035AEDEB3